MGSTLFFSSIASVQAEPITCFTPELREEVLNAELALNRLPPKIKLIQTLVRADTNTALYFDGVNGIVVAIAFDDNWCQNDYKPIFFALDAAIVIFGKEFEDNLFAKVPNLKRPEIKKAPLSPKSNA